MVKLKIKTKELSPELWKDVELLFGSNGACGGCWCQYWKVCKGEKWEDIKGAKAKRRFKKEITEMKTFGTIAYEGERPVGWCSFGPRITYPALERARTLQCSDAENVWSITCFFVLKEYRKKGIAASLLKASLKGIKKRGGVVAEGYPSKPNPEGKYVDAFAWTGTLSLFENEGFKVEGKPGGSKVRVRKTVK